MSSRNCLNLGSVLLLTFSSGLVLLHVFQTFNRKGCGMIVFYSILAVIFFKVSEKSEANGEKAVVYCLPQTW